jgi:hypothetical protein
VRIVGVVIRAAAHGELELRREAEIVAGRALVVVGVIRLERVHAGCRVPLDPLIVLDQDWVRQGGHAPCVVNATEDLLG